MNRFSFLVLFAAMTSAAWAQCDNPQACNYDPEGTEPCNFNASNQDLSAGVLVGIPFGQAYLDTTATCAVQPINDQLVQMAPNADGYLQFVIDDTVYAYFTEAVASGAVTQQQADQFLGLMTYSTFAFCGDEMTVNLPGLGVQVDTYSDGYWFLGEMIGYYVAPAVNSEQGCGDPMGLNFDLCAIPNPDLCTYPAVMCDDPLACNYEEGSTGTDECVYFDTDHFTIGENDFLGLYDFDGCASGYAGWNDLPVPLAQDAPNQPLYFVLFPAVEDILIMGGFEFLATDLQTLLVSVCADTMNYQSTVAGDLDLYWDGYGFENSLYGGYIAPESSFVQGCPDPDACNFDPCSHPFTFDLCEYVPEGTLSGDTIVVNGGTYAYTFEGQAGSTYDFYSPCGEVTADGNTATLTVNSEVDCQLCVEELTADGCASVTCQNLTIQPSSVADAFAAEWSLAPNPAANRITIKWSGATATWAIHDAQGREVRRIQVNPGMTTVDVGDLATGQYLVGPLNGAKQRLSVIH